MHSSAGPHTHPVPSLTRARPASARFFLHVTATRVNPPCAGLLCHQQYADQEVKTFPLDYHRIQVVGTNQISGMTVTKWLYRGTIQCSMTSPINHLLHL